MTLRRPLSFTIYGADGALLRTETVDREIIKIGRLASCHVSIDDDTPLLLQLADLLLDLGF